jgi:hypothetical protein
MLAKKAIGGNGVRDGKEVKELCWKSTQGDEAQRRLSPIPQPRLIVTRAT